MNVLIVEDEIFSAHRLKLLLEKNAISVAGIVDNGAEALVFCRERHPDAVLMDIMIKGPLSGIETAMEIGEDFPEIFVIFLTAYSDSEIIEYAARSGAFGYLMKPYREGEIITTLQLIRARITISGTVSKRLDTDGRVLLSGNYMFDLGRNTLFRGEGAVPLSSNSRKLLAVLCRNAGVFVSTEQILESVWGEVGSMSGLRSLIYRLKSTTGILLIENHNKVGYRIILRSKVD